MLITFLKISRKALFSSSKSLVIMLLSNTLSLKAFKMMRLCSNRVLSGKTLSYTFFKEKSDFTFS